ncbi:hypothetical protein PFISCL1PPCAC_8029, partial [Pristionchus fissidentatus]
MRSRLLQFAESSEGRELDRVEEGAQLILANQRKRTQHLKRRSNPECVTAVVGLVGATVEATILLEYSPFDEFADLLPGKNTLVPQSIGQRESGNGTVRRTAMTLISGHLSDSSIVVDALLHELAQSLPVNARIVAEHICDGNSAIHVSHVALRLGALTRETSQFSLCLLHSVQNRRSLDLAHVISQNGETQQRRVSLRQIARIVHLPTYRTLGIDGSRERTTESTRILSSSSKIQPINARRDLVLHWIGSRLDSRSRDDYRIL